MPSVFLSPDLHTARITRPSVRSRAPKKRISDADRARDEGSVGMRYPSSERPFRGSTRIWRPTKVGKHPKATDAKESKRLRERGMVVVVVVGTGLVVRRWEVT